jgi:hypothetical protein
MGVPSRLGRYVVRRRLGSGGFATVWLAHDEQLDAEVAVKVLADNWAHDDSVRRRFLEEGRFLRRVESEHVVQVHDVGELEDGRPFLVLTYADGGTLAARLQEGPLDLASAVGVIVQVGRGLQALHRRGLLHRDVKPANVLFRRTDDGERAVLSDLGLGKSLDEVSRITMPGGTPSYVAPEQAMGERLDQRADEYALGAVAYAALTGRSPHQLDGLGAAGRVAAPPPPSSLGFAVPDRIDAAIVRALEPDREKRWPDVEAFTRELVGALDEATSQYLPLPVAAAPAQPALGVHPEGPVAPADRGQTALIDSEQAAPPDEPQTAAPDPPPTPAADQERAAPVDQDETALIDPGRATAAEAAQPVDQSGEKAAGTGRSRRRRWPVAALVLLVLGGGAGFAAQRSVANGQLMEVAQNGFSVKVPRGWVRSIGKPIWYPPGSDDGMAALRVSADDHWDDATAGTTGVFLGLLPSGQAPVDGKGASRPAQSRVELPSQGARCTQVEEPTSGTRNGTVYKSQYSSKCDPDGGIVLERITTLPGGQSIRIQIQAPASARSQAWDVAESVTYTRKGPS